MRRRKAGIGNGGDGNDGQDTPKRGPRIRAGALAPWGGAMLPTAYHPDVVYFEVGMSVPVHIVRRVNAPPVMLGETPDGELFQL